MRIRKHLSLNEQESNELWLVVFEIHGEIGDSKTIKKCLADSIKLHRLEEAAQAKGINLEKFLGVSTNPPLSKTSQHSTLE